MSRVAAFLHRRFQPNEPYGWPLTLGLAVSLLALQLFLVGLSAVKRGGALVQFDKTCAVAMKEHADEHEDLLKGMRLVTHVGGVPVIVALSVLGAGLLWWRHHRLLAIGWVIAAAGGGALNVGTKWLIARDRPGETLGETIRDPAVTERNKSFPSGHSMGSVIGFGALGYVAVLLLRRPSARFAVVLALTLLVLVIGFSRIYLRAHWFSDVLGGFAIGTFWLSLCITGMEILRLRAQAQAQAAAGAVRVGGFGMP
jgi:undecaprenyl-diphosphatase